MNRGLRESGDRGGVAADELERLGGDRVELGALRRSLLLLELRVARLQRRLKP